MKRQITEWEVFTKHIIDKGLCVEYIKTQHSVIGIETTL